MKQKIEDTEYTIGGWVNRDSSPKQVILCDGDTKELWVHNQNHASYGVVIDGEDYEFVRAALLGDLWWAGIKMTQELVQPFMHRQ